MTIKRYAAVACNSARASEIIEAYMPGNYRVIGETYYDGDDRLYKGTYVVIQGEDNAGWTLDNYVIPRLSTGPYPAREIDLSHPIMKLIPERS